MASFCGCSTTEIINLLVGSVITPPHWRGISANLNANAQKANSNYRSVQEQTGIFAGEGGFDINVNNHTQLNGAAINASAPADKNRLETGSLAWTDLENEANVDVSASGLGLGTGLGNMTDIALVTASSALPLALSRQDDAQRTTRASVSPGTIIINQTPATEAQLNNLSRQADPNVLTPIFDLEKEQNRLAFGATMGQIVQSAADVIVHAQLKDEYQAFDQAQARYEQNPLSHIAFNERETQRLAFEYAQKNYGSGSAFGRATQALSGLVAGLGGNNLQQGLVNAANPYLAQGVGQYFDMLEANGEGGAATQSARLLAHAAIGAATAALTNQSPVSGASGAVSGELTAQLVKTQLYGDRPLSQLTAQEKENIRAAAILASGLIGKVQGDDFKDATVSAAASYNAVSNNFNREPSYQGELSPITVEVQGKEKEKNPAEIAQAMLNEAIVKEVLNTALDVTPVVGDVKAFAEAETPTDVAIAIVGVFPFSKLGKVAIHSVKGGKLLYEVIKLKSKNRILAREPEFAGVPNVIRQVEHQGSARSSGSRMTSNEVKDGVKPSVKKEQNSTNEFEVSSKKELEVQAQKRVTHRKSEEDVGIDLGSDWEPQPSFYNGERVKYGTKGSTRPDFCHKYLLECVEVKNYDLSTPSRESNFARRTSNQMYQRSKHLPKGTKQELRIDIRGQNVSREKRASIIAKFTKSYRKRAGADAEVPSIIFKDK